jgi:hypothetical protein
MAKGMKAVPAASSKAKVMKVMKAAPASSSKAKAKPAKAQGAKLTPKKLALLGNISLTEKVKQAVEGAETPEEAAEVLKASMSKLEQSKVWGQHQTHLKHSADDAKAFNDLDGKKSKGLASALWFIQNKSTKFQSLQQSVSGTITVAKKDEWLSEKQAVDKFGADELQAHLYSGRIIAKEDPITRGVWQYKDINDVTRTQNVAKNKTISRGEEYKPSEEEDALFDELFDQDPFRKISY